MTFSFKTLIFIVFLLPWSGKIWATHNRAGDITYVQIGPLKIRLTVTTYTKTSSGGADRDSVDVFWGDGQRHWIYRVNGPLNNGERLENDIKRNFYVAEHTYPGVGTYTVSMTDPNRVGNILNLNFPNSVGIQFHLATTLTLLNSTIQGYNNSVVLLQPPIDFGCIGKKFIHNLNAYDPDGDSLSFDLIVPFQARGSEVPNYRFPDQIIAGPDNKISLDRATGNFTWESPQREGEYNIAFLIKEYRNGILLNSIIRDMQITIENCSNDPPEITIPKDFCVVAGTRIEFNVEARDKNLNQKIAISALGGPFNVGVNKAQFIAAAGFQNQVASGKLIWQTSCEHISEVSYAIVFRAIDNFKDSTGLADLKTIRIKIVGPPPRNVTAIPNGNNVVRVNWTYPNFCVATTNNFFKGFSIWRRINSNQFKVDSCTTGLSGRGYQRITSNVVTRAGDVFYFDDDMLEPGKTHCYRILAEFALTSPGGNSYNRVASLPSEEACIQLKRDLPFITKASIQTTNTSNGSVLLKWVVPLAHDLDTIKNTGPYKIVIQRANGFISQNNPFMPIPGGTFTANSLAAFNDTMHIDNNLNTSDRPYSYQIQFFTGPAGSLYGVSSSASTVYLKSTSADRTVNLSWTSETPWNNFSYEIYRKTGAEPLQFVGTSNVTSFKDKTVRNGLNYCYVIETIGTYGINGLPTPIQNFSQEVCITPVDNTPPCVPKLAVIRNCILKNAQGNTVNELSWSISAMDTCFVDDLKSIQVYFKKTLSSVDLLKIQTFTDLSITKLSHTPDSGFTGCYIITATDQNGNESLKSGEICPQNCNLSYELPNSFTPNSDGSNDLFTPRLNSGVIKVRFEVFNRWGEMLFTTEDPALNWDGHDRNDKEVGDGTYYYTCAVVGFQQNNAQVIEQRKGYIQILR